MPRYLVEVSQIPDQVADRRIGQSVSALGSHFATHADWRRQNGERTGSMIVEAADKWGALGIVPPSLRSYAHILPLNSAMAA